MPFQINYTQVPIDKQSDQRFVDLYYWMQDKFADPRNVEEICVHEAGHFFYFMRCGAIDWQIQIPSITYSSARDEFDYANGSVQAVTWSDEFRQLSNRQKLESLAMIGTAGELATVTILNRGAGNGAGDKLAFQSHCEKANVSCNQCANIWNAVEKYTRKHLQASDVQQTIRTIADELCPQLFKTC